MTDNEATINNIIGNAEEVIMPSEADGPPTKPRLLVENTSPDETVAKLRDILAATGGIYDRGVPVRVALDQTQRGHVAQVMTPDSVVLMAHQLFDRSG